MRFFVSVVFSVLFLLSSMSSASDLDGQIFIVTKGQQTIRLPLITITLISQKKVKDAIETDLKAKLLAIQNVNEEIELKKAEYFSLKKSVEIKEEGKDVHPFIEFEQLKAVCFPVGGIASATLDACFKTEKGKLALARMNALTSTYRPDFEARRVLLRELFVLLEKHRLISKEIRDRALLAGPEDATGKSDVDGKFVIEGLKPGSYFAVARANRSVAGANEEYEWIVDVVVKAKGRNQLVLANDNLVGENCGACAKLLGFRTYPKINGADSVESIILK